MGWLWDSGPLHLWGFTKLLYGIVQGAGFSNDALATRVGNTIIIMTNLDSW